MKNPKQTKTNFNVCLVFVKAYKHVLQDHFYVMPSRPAHFESVAKFRLVKQYCRVIEPILVNIGTSWL